MQIVTRALAFLALALVIHVAVPTAAQAAPAISKVEATATGYAIVGTGFGSSAAKIQVLEGYSQVAAGKIASVAPDRIVVNSTPTGLTQITVLVGGARSNTVAYAGGMMQRAQPERLRGTPVPSTGAPAAGTPAPVSVQSITFEPATAVGGDAVDMMTTLTAEATGDVRINLSSSHPAIVAVPSYVTMVRYQTSAHGQYITNAVTADTTVTITAATGEGASARTVTRQLLVRPLAIESVTVTPTTTPGGVPNQTTYGTVRLNSMGRGMSVPISSSHPAVAAVQPSSMSFPGTARDGQFLITTHKIATDTTVTFTAGQGSAAKTATLLVQAPKFTGIELYDTYHRGSGSPFPIVGGTPTLDNMFLVVRLKTDIGGPPGGMTIALSSSDPVLPLPTSATVPPNTTAADVNVAPLSVSSDMPVTITARYGTTSYTAAVLVKAIAPDRVVFGSPTIFGGASTTVSVALTYNAPPGGIVVPLRSSNPAVTVPATVTVPAGSPAGTATLTTTGVPQDTQVVVTAGQGAGAKTGTITVQGLAPSALTVSPATVVGGAPATGTLTLNGPAGTGGLSVPLASNIAAAAVPASVTVPANSRTATFSIATSAVAIDTTGTITVGSGAGARTASISLPAFGLSSLSITPQSLTGGTTTTGAVALVGPAPAGGLSVPLASNIASATVPASVTVPAGATSATFTITTSAVSAVTTGAISAGQGAGAKTSTIIVRP